MEQIEHFSHIHPLLLKEEQKNDKKQLLCSDDGHRHAFMLLINPKSLVCYACGMEVNEDLACRCTICQIWVHSSCAELPLAIRINGHNHRLKLTYALHHHYGFGEDEDEESFTDYETEHSQDIDFTFSLKFMEDQSTLQYFEKLCDGCAQPIMPPFFSCQEENCGFFLHQSCAELPRTKQHPFHVHPLTLLSKAPPYDGIYRCDGCRTLSNGFVYRCDECQFDLDVCCGSLKERVEHKSHMHPLFLKKTSVARQCKGCHLWSKHVLMCDDCEDFAIDCGCVALPFKAWHMYDKHPLSLNYFVEGNLRECECCICNEKMPPKQWFYYCDECDFAAHPYCIVGKSKRVKFGSSFQYNVHPQSLALTGEIE
ncbi:protein-disulfide reductase [Spatholobus suberectus]|nr:protein-disulfide reductase [Spatholobus suberectus]